MRSYNVNLKVIYELPYACHNWLVEELTGGNHALVRIYSKYIKFINNLVNNKRDSIKSLLKIVQDNVRSTTGGNLRKILLDTGMLIVPGVSNRFELRNFRVYQNNEREEWRLPLLISLLEIREENWEIMFSDDDDNKLEAGDNDVEDMIVEVCTT